MQTYSFEEKLQESQLNLRTEKIQKLQINIGRICNLACHHCHVEAGPKRTEMMDEKTALRTIELIKKSKEIKTVDLTGGAPELNPNFKNIVIASKKAGKEVIVRCNITVLFEKGQEDTALFFKNQKVNIVASMPCYSKKNVEQQRGTGVFDKSIDGLKILNQLGYGKENTGLILDLVYNPGGAFLPPDQHKLELDYKKELKELFDIEFNRLFTITNMPIKRFLNELTKQNKLNEYMELLINSFNSKAVDSLMCKTLVSVSYNGQLFNCDFNQMVDLPIGNTKKSIWDIETFDNVFEDENVSVANHCFACTAGAGSSCGGALKTDNFLEKNI